MREHLIEAVRNFYRFEMNSACDTRNQTKENEVYVKCLIEMILRFDSGDNRRPCSPQKRKGLIFVSPWDDLSFSRVHVRGVVTNCTAIGSSGFQISVDDGTGRICGVFWIKNDDSSPIKPERLFNSFVSMKGQLAGFRSEMQIRIDDVSIIATDEEPTEESLWLLEVREEWESLAARKVSSGCPCLCHTFNGVSCKALGSPAVWSDSFNRAVAVVSSSLRLAAASESNSVVETCMNEIVNLVQSNCNESPSLSYRRCFPSCAVVESVRDLIKKGFIRKEEQRLFLYSHSVTDTLTINPLISKEPRFPQTPVVVPSQGPPKNRSVPKFFAAVSD